MQPAIKDRIGGVLKYQLPRELAERYSKACRLERVTVAYLTTVIIVMYLAMGASSAMKAAWIEDVVSMFPAVAFLVASRFHNRNSDQNYPYGYHKAFTVAFVGGSLALLVLGLYVLVDSVLSLVRQDHPTIGSMNLFGREIWVGWAMILALLYSCIPAMIIGRKKLPLASDLHEKVLYVDSEAQKADWMTAVAGIIGVLGVGFGFWWVDALAAILISLNIVYDGVSRTRDSMKDLMEELPMTFDNKKVHPLVEDVIKLCLSRDWVKDVRVRMREHGMVFFGDVLVIPRSEDNLVEKIEELTREAGELDWKIEDLVISPVKKFPNEKTRD